MHIHLEKNVKIVHRYVLMYA